MRRVPGENIALWTRQRRFFPRAVLALDLEQLCISLSEIFIMTPHRNYLWGVYVASVRMTQSNQRHSLPRLESPLCPIYRIYSEYIVEHRPPLPHGRASHSCSLESISKREDSDRIARQLEVTLQPPHLTVLIIFK
jgi:hypothetical protein